MSDRIAALQQLVSPFGKVLSLFSFQKDDECILVYLSTVIITYHIIISLFIYFIYFYLFIHVKSIL